MTAFVLRPSLTSGRISSRQYAQAVPIPIRAFQRSRVGLASPMLKGFRPETVQTRSVIARDALDNIADALRPGFLPRPVAKGLIFFFGASFVWSLVQKLLSFTLLLGLVGGGAFLFVKSKTSSIGGGSSSSNNDDDDGNPLASARKIMDKYK